MSHQDPKEISSGRDFLELVRKSGGGAFGTIVIVRTGRFALDNPDLANRAGSEGLVHFYKAMLENPVLAVQAAPGSQGTTTLNIQDKAGCTGNMRTCFVRTKWVPVPSQPRK